MIKALKRGVIIMIIALVAAAGGGGYGLYEYLMPMREQKEAEVQAVQAEIEAKRAEVAKLKEEFILLQIQLRKFKELEANGFFNNQNRVKAQEAFKRLGELSGLLKTRYSIEPGILVDVKQAADANNVVLQSRVTLDLESLDDVDVFTFIKGLQEKFPGSVDMTSIDLMRTKEFSVDLLREIGGGDPVSVVSTKLVFDWRTMANKDHLDEADTSSSASPPEPIVIPIGIPAPNIDGGTSPQSQSAGQSAVTPPAVAAQPGVQPSPQPAVVQ